MDTTQTIGLSHGDGPIAYSEIRAWDLIAGFELTLWEVETMRHLSSSYLNALRTTEDDNAEPYFETELSHEKRAREYAERRKAVAMAKANG